MTEHYTFAASETGLTHALLTTLNLRRHGYKTRLATRELCKFKVHTVVATPATKPNTQGARL